MRRSRALLTSLASLALTAACEAPRAGPPVSLPLTVVTSTTVQAQLPTDVPLRLSLSFRGGGGVDTSTVVFDAPFTPPLTVIEVGGGEAPVLSGPLYELLAYVGGGTDGFGLRLRFTDLVLYADGDGDGALTSADRPLSVSADVGFAPAIADQLATLSLISADYYYSTTDDRISSYVRIASFGGTIAVIDHLSPIAVGVTPEVFVRNELSCPRIPRIAVPFDRTPTRTVRVAEDLDPDAICGLEEADCLPLDLSVAPPDIDRLLPSVERARVRGCRRSTTLELLVVEDRSAGCRECSCGWATDTRAFVVRTSSVPTWWPCGGSDAPYCDAPGSLLDIPAACRARP